MPLHVRVGIETIKGWHRDYEPCGGGEGITQGQEANEREQPLFPHYFIGLIALVAGVTLIAISVLGPLGTESIQYRTSQSGIWQTQGGDLVNLVLVSPILLIGGILHLLRREGSKYFLVLSPVTLMYVGLSLGIGQEWGNPDYTGNVENYAYLYLIIIIAGVILLVSSLSMFSPKDAPEFKPRGLKVFVGVMGLFMLMFALMWLSELVEVMRTGDAASDAYAETPVLWWVVRFFDLGVTIPLGFLALYLLLTRPKKAYSMVLLFFGFFVTLGTGVLAMGIVMVVNDDPAAQVGALPIFGALAVLSWVGLLYLVKDKLSALLGRSSGKAVG